MCYGNVSRAKGTQRSSPTLSGDSVEDLRWQEPLGLRFKSESLRQAKRGGGHRLCEREQEKNMGKAWRVHPVGLKQVIRFYLQGIWEPRKNFMQGNKASD